MLVLISDANLLSKVEIVIHLVSIMHLMGDLNLVFVNYFIDLVEVMGLVKVPIISVKVIKVRIAYWEKVCMSKQVFHSRDDLIELVVIYTVNFRKV